MSSIPIDDQDQDLEIDAEGDEVVAVDDDASGDAAAASPPVPEIDPDIEHELKRVILEEEPVKAKNQMLPAQLIDKELEPEDLFDPGSI